MLQARCSIRIWNKLYIYIYVVCRQLLIYFSLSLYVRKNIKNGADKIIYASLKNNFEFIYFEIIKDTECKTTYWADVSFSLTSHKFF